MGYSVPLRVRCFDCPEKPRELFLQVDSGNVAKHAKEACEVFGWESMVDDEGDLVFYCPEHKPKWEEFLYGS